MSFFRHASPTVRLGVVTATAGTVAAGSYYLTRQRHQQWPRAEPQRDAQGRIITPSFPKIPSRTEQIAALRQNGTKTDAADGNAPDYDLLVIGGGATGTGIAMDAATRGLKVALVERGDFASGTSSKSTKLVHGGVRYLEKAFWNLDYAQFELVVEALSERKTFLTGAPHLSGSVPILIPLYSWWQAPYFWAGTKAYDLLAGSEGLESSYILSRSKSMDAFPLLKRDGLLGGLVFYDGQHNDSRMNVTIALTAALYGATVANYVEVTALEKDAQGKVRGVKVRDALPGAAGDEFVIRAKGVVNATGAFADSIEKMTDPSKADIVCPSSGVHLSLPGTLSPHNMGLLDANTSDGRVIYFLPWQGKMIAGTTDTPCRAERDVVAQENDIAFILEEVRKNLAPGAPVTRDAVTSAWSGIRPLVRDPKSKNTESLVRNHLVTVDDAGLLTCAGGKWTTYRQMAEDAVDEAVKVFGLHPKAVPAVNVSGLGATASDLAVAAASANPAGPCATKQLRMVGAHGYGKSLPAELATQYGFDAETAAALAANYGDRAWQVADLSAAAAAATPKLSPAFPVLESEVRHAVRNEYAQTAADFVSRRTRMSFLDVEAALEALPRVVDLMAEELQWDGARTGQEWDSTVRHLVSMGLPATLASVSRADVLEGKHKAAIEAGKHPQPVAGAVEEAATKKASAFTDAAVEEAHA